MNDTDNLNLSTITVNHPIDTSSPDYQKALAFKNWWDTQYTGDRKSVLDYNRQFGIYMYGMDPYADYSPHDSFLDKVMDGVDKVADPIMEATIDATPYLLALSLGDAAGLGSLFGAGGVGGSSAGASAAGAGLGDAGMLGADAIGASIPIDTAGLQSMGWMDALGSAGGAAGAGAGLGGLAQSAGGVGSIGSLPVDTGMLQTLPTSVGTVSGTTGGGLGSILSGNGSGLPHIPNIFGSGGSGGGSGGGWGDILNVLGANTDRIHNQQDAEYWQNIMDKAMGMYQPGTPEATLMQKQMEAQDAAAGRNSQYGVRADNLAAALAGQRAKIMTSYPFYQMGAASRGHYDNSLNSLFGALGQSGGAGGSGGLGSILGSLGSIGNSTSGFWGDLGTGLSDLFGGWGGI